MARRRKNWRGGWLGWVLNIHSPSAHQMEVCWCRGTKREIFPVMYTASMAMADAKAFAGYFNEVSNLLENKEKDKHGEGTGTTS